MPHTTARRRIASLSVLATLTVLLAAACAEPSETPSGEAELVADQETVPKLDMHAHFWKPHADLVPTLESWNMRALLVNVASDTSLLEEKWAGMLALDAAHPGRFVLCTTFDPFRFNEPDFVEQTIAGLRRDIDQGARMVKVWKNIGLELKDDQGAYVQIDHPRFQPIWDFLVEEGIPVLAHIAEPQAAWLPLDERNPHYGYYSTHPEYHAYNHPEMPRWEAIIAARDRWVEANPDLVIVGAHLGSLSHDVAEVARRLDAYPNFHVETAARFNDLAMQPSDTVRAFMIRYQDRILYGTDHNNGTVEGGRLGPRSEQYFTYLAGADSMLFGSPNGWNTRTLGLGLPREALEKIYAGNAGRILGLTEEAAARPDLAITYYFAAEATYDRIEVDEDTLRYTYFDDPDNRCAEWLRQEPCWRGQYLQTVRVPLSDEDVEGLIGLVHASGFMDLEDTYGGAASEQRYYPYTVTVSLGEREKRVEYQSFPDAEPMPAAQQAIIDRLHAFAKGRE